MRKIRGTAVGVSVLLFLILGHAQVPTAQAPTVTPPVAHPPAIPSATAAPTPVHPLDQADLTAFFDGILPLQLERSDIAGASVLVMKDGQVLLQKGYGYADVKSKRSV